MSIILHITRVEDWRLAQASGGYETASLRSHGFIHCSKLDQVLGVANFRFRGQPDLVLLCVDTERLAAPLRHENLEGGAQRFPHIYGPLNLDAVTAVIDFAHDEDGTFTLPDRLRDVCDA